ncbi:MAG: beta-CASP ribonuclease aCPSF1 [Candidatus Aenigmatarchaeota archaeon]|nr:beta-CASP ribonuclease aCPSF1 [Candidatus Aenigmarchaeota archaeon]
MDILEKVKSSFPKDVIERVELEGCEIVIYTKDKVFFLDAAEQVRELVSELKKRIEVRLENSMCMQPENAKKKIEEIVPAEAAIKDIYFEPERSIVFIIAEKPGLVIGKGGETLKKLKESILWVPKIERSPEITSNIVKSTRNLIHEEAKWRVKFLKQVGKNIFSEKTTNRDWVRMFCLGSFREVGRSCIMFETPKSKVLVDCGINAGGSGNNRYPYINVKEFDLSEIDAIILSHAHLDHCGFVPYLYEYGFDGPLYCTPPVLDLFTLLNMDYIDVMQKQGTQPLFTAKGVKEAIKHAITIDYNEVSDVGPDIRLTFQPNGHMLGGGQVHLHIGQGLHNIVYTADIKFTRSRLFDPAFTNFQRIETLIIESTYGSSNDVMPSRQEAEDALMDIINRTMQRNGICLIPSFAVGRAQEIMAILDYYKFEYPVFVDGMIWDSTAIHTAYPEYMSKSIESKILQGENPFTNSIFKRLASQQDREKAWENRPCVIISTSGMLEGGPIMSHLSALGEDKRNSLVFVGYQAEGSLGRRIQKGWREIPINSNGKNVTLKLELEVKTIDGLSGHADVKELFNFVHRLRSRPERIIVNHGEENKPIALASALHKAFRAETIAPKNLETIRLV